MQFTPFTATQTWPQVPLHRIRPSVFPSCGLVTNKKRSLVLQAVELRSRLEPYFQGIAFFQILSLHNASFSTLVLVKMCLRAFQFLNIF